MTLPDIPDSATVVVAGDVLTSEFDAELVILNLQDGVYYGLEDVGARIWSLLREPITMPGLCRAIASEYDVPPARCERDIRSLVGTLVSKGLVRIHGRT